MRRSPKQNAAVVLILSLMLGLATAASAQVIPGNVTNLDVPVAGGWAILPTSINDHGVVTANLSCTCPPSAMLWDKATGWHNIGGTGFWTYPTAINNNGVVIGYDLNDAANGNDAVMWDSVNLWRPMGFDLGSVGLPHDINDSGLVIGYSGPRGFSFSEAAGLTFLPDFLPLRVNNAGQMIGLTANSIPSVREANGTIRLLSPANTTQVADINNAGVSVGAIHLGGRWQAAMWSADGTLTAIPALGAFDYDDFENGPTHVDYAEAIGVNDLGQIVGLSSDQYGHFVPFLWDAVSGMREIIVPGVVGYTRPIDINNNGEVIALIVGGNDRGLYFTVPLPAPPNPGYTPAGTNVHAAPIDQTTGASPVTITFGNVTGAGNTTLETSTTWFPAPPSTLKIGLPPVYYDLHTTATFTGSATVCINYTGQSFLLPESTLKLYHLEGGTWRDRTVSLNTTTNMICASVTSFSPFVILQQNYARLSITPTTTRRGSLVRFSAALQNPSTTQWQWMRVDIATSGSCLPAILTDFPVLLNKGETKSISLPLPILPRACLGTYEVTLVGKIDGVVVGQSTVALTVTP